MFRACCGARRCAVARFRRELVLRDGSSGEYVGAALVFELWGLCAVILRQRVANLACCSGELGGVFVFGGYETQRPKNLNKTQNTKLQPNEVVAIWRGRAAEWMSPAACGGAKDMELARTKAPLLLTFFWQGRKKSAAGGTAAVARPPRKNR